MTWDPDKIDSSGLRDRIEKSDAYGRPLPERAVFDGSDVCKPHSHPTGHADYPEIACDAHHPKQFPNENNGAPFCVVCGAGMVRQSES